MRAHIAARLLESKRDELALSRKPDTAVGLRLRHRIGRIEKGPFFAGGGNVGHENIRSAKKGVARGCGRNRDLAPVWVQHPAVDQFS